jgi:hypothetical protein
MAKMTHHNKPIINFPHFCFFSTTKLCILLVVSNSTSFWYPENQVILAWQGAIHPTAHLIACELTAKLAQVQGTHHMHMGREISGQASRE